MRLIYNLWKFFTLFSFLNYIIILLLALRIYLFLHKQTRVISPENNHVQRQITLTIGGQSLIPIVTLYLPLFLLTVIGMSNKSDEIKAGNKLKSGIVFKLYALIPTLNPIIAIVAITAYRKAVIRVFSHCWTTLTTNQSTSIQPSNNIIFL
jgi:hypothetical protein